MNRKKIIGALENSLDTAETSKKKMRLHYLLAKFYVKVKDDGLAIFHFFESKYLLRYIGERGLMGFRNFYRYREKLECLEFFIEPMIVKY